MATRRGVLVVGSSNVDTVIYLDRFASPGETVQATGKIVSCGGKGANRAVAAARASAETTFVTALGEDREGRMRLEDEIAENQTIEQLLDGLCVYSTPILFLIC